MPTPAENFNTTLNQVLCDRVCGMTTIATENTTLTTMDGYWAAMTTGEKQTVVNYFGYATAPTARVSLGKTSFPKGCYTLPEQFNGLPARYTV
jgi:hypothetical protein